MQGLEKATQPLHGVGTPGGPEHRDEMALVLAFGTDCWGNRHCKTNPIDIYLYGHLAGEEEVGGDGERRLSVD